jgi:putative addiction module killer protein
MIEIRKTRTFSDWIGNLKDLNAIARVDVRVRRLSLGNRGDAKSLGDGVYELRIDYGPGYRVYYTQRGSVIVVLLCGGDKRTQDKDIRTAKLLAKEYGNDT